MVFSNHFRSFSALVFLLCFLNSESLPIGWCQQAKTKEEIVRAFFGKVPKEWGEAVRGVKTKLHTDQKVLGLTFDACGGSPKNSRYDTRLIEYLEKEKIPATLFLSGGWIEANVQALRKLAQNPLFEIENHGLAHRPCSVNGRSAYGIAGTRNVAELVDEIEENASKIMEQTGRRPRLYRPGTAYCDEVGVQVVNALGYEVVTFGVLGDAGATYSKSQVREALLNAPPSSMILMHMNHPEAETAEGLMEAIPELKKRGFRFVRLSEYGLK